MKFARWAFAFLFVLALALLAADAFAQVYATEKTRSEFLNSFSAHDVLSRFRDNKYGAHGGGSADSGGGRDFVIQRVNSWTAFVINDEARPGLPSKVREEISARLLKAGARIIEQRQSSEGLETRYELGKSRGLVLILPLYVVNPKDVVGARRLCPGDTAVGMSIRVAETWSPLPADQRQDQPHFRPLW